MSKKLEGVRNYNWFIVDEFYGHNGVFTYVLAHVLYDSLELLADKYVAKETRYFLARELSPRVYIAYEALSPNFGIDVSETGCPIDERSEVYVSAKAEAYA